MTAADQRFWLENTPAGHVYREYNLPERRSLADIDHDVDLVNAEYRTRFGRDLTDAEKATVRRGAEMRSGPWYAGGNRELGLEELHSRLGYGIGVPSRSEGWGIAVRDGGVWRGDPKIVAQMQAMEASGTNDQQYRATVQAPTKGVPRVS